MTEFHLCCVTDARATLYTNPRFVFKRTSSVTSRVQLSEGNQVVCVHEAQHRICAIAVSVGVIVPVTRGGGPHHFSSTRVTSGSCPAGTLTGGGVGPLPGNYYGSYSSTEYALTGSYPSGSSWRATATVTRGTYSSTSGWRYSTSSYSPRVYSICAS